MAHTTRPRASVGSRPLLLTKLHPPARRDHTIVRERLVQSLRASVGVKLTVLAAPAGCGKTTLLGTWRDVEETLPVAWLTLDEGDNDPVVLWLHIVEALRRVCPNAVERVRPPASAARVVDVVVRQLLNEVAEQQDVVLILDDFHRLSAGSARDSIAWLIEHAPPTLHVVLGTRSEPALPLGTMRVRGELLELRAHELAFTEEEAAALLNGALGLDLAPEDVDRLVERIEGWPAGVYLAGLSLAGVVDRHAFVSSYGGTSRHVVDFLVDEVLDAHDAQTQSLMLRSSILDRLSGSLCDAVLESDDSARLLRRLARTNLFLLPLDDAGEWYRFHHLFAQLLRVELEHREPGITQTLHLRAYAWHRSRGFVDEAIKHAQQAGAYGEARDVIAGAWLKTASAGRHATVLAWVDGFPPELSRTDPSLLLIRAWMSSLAGAREEAAAAITQLEQLHWDGEPPLADGCGSLEASLATLRGAFAWGDVGTARTNALRAVELVPAGSPIRPAATWSLATACYFRDELDAAERWFDETVQLAGPDERWLLTTSALAYRSLIAAERGSRGAQRSLADGAADVAREHGLEEIAGEVHVAVGLALEADGDIEAALESLERAVTVLRRGQPLDLALALICHARVLRAARRDVDASAAVAEAAATIDSCADPGTLRRRLEALEPRPLPHDVDADLSRRELVVLRMLKGSLSERDIGRELYLSHNTVHSHTKSIYRKLGVSSRKQAVQRGVMLGLL
ncbi:MAG TPA: LuxR C-terminal-related transcriptional regulator [Gaiellaceae bacterium]